MTRFPNAPIRPRDPAVFRRVRPFLGSAALLTALACAPGPPQTVPASEPTTATAATTATQPVTAPPATVRIGEIQGAGHTSPFVGRRVETEGVVTGVGDLAFFIQSIKDDGDEATSEGLCIRWPATTTDTASKDAPDQPGLPDLKVGQHVRLRGVVEEFTERDNDLPVTCLRFASATKLGKVELPAAVRLFGDGRAIPKRIADDDQLTRFEPGSDGVDFFESLEGMRVRVENALVTGPTSRRGDLFAMAEKGGGDAALHPRGGLLRRDGDAGPEVLHIDGGLGTPPPVADIGQRLDALEAIVDYERGGYRLRLVTPVAATGQGPPPEKTRLGGDDRHLTVASFNVLNLAATDPPRKSESLARLIVEHLRSPDVIAVQEIQDDTGGVDDGTVTAGATYRVLIDAIRSAGGPEYGVRQLDPVNNADGGRPGGNIRVGFLFRPDRLDAVDTSSPDGSPSPRFTLEEGRVRLRPSPARLLDPAFDRHAATGNRGTRKPLVTQFRFHDRDLFLVNLHLRSKGGDDSAFGAAHPPQRQTEGQRTRQAEAVGRLVDGLLTVDPGAWIVVLGDLNEHRNRPPLEALESRLVNLLTTVPVEQRYSYVYRGQAQVLDHILVSPAVAEQAAPEVDIVHAAAEYAAERQASDHDPLVVRLRF